MHAPSRSLFLTGNPGVGKTTLLVNVVNSVAAELVAGNLDVNLRGFYTRNADKMEYALVLILCASTPTKAFDLLMPALTLRFVPGTFLHRYQHGLRWLE